jgi:hypothetical protein
METINIASMKFFLIAAAIMSFPKGKAQEIYDFTAQSNMDDWFIVDDVVMGGRSSGGMKLSPDGHAVFEGKVSLENNGGFSSVRYRSDQISTSAHSVFKIRVKGDGKNYQFRVKSSLNQRHSYVYEFSTSGEWEVIEVPFIDMYPSFRGMTLAIPNYPGQELQECSFLISNKKNESFRLEIDRVWME